MPPLSFERAERLGVYKGPESLGGGTVRRGATGLCRKKPTGHAGTQTSEKLTTDSWSILSKFDKTGTLALSQLRASHLYGYVR
jgi:hypothetical protein